MVSCGITSMKEQNKMKNELEVTSGKFWWEDEGLLFECLQCGGCCGGEPGAIWVTAGEIKSIADFLGEDEEEFRSVRLRWDYGRNSIREQPNYDCLFLKRTEKLCAIYQVRPSQCSLFPFWPSMLRDREVWDYYAARCPGMDGGRRYTPEMIRALQKQSAWLDL